ncbi:MAG TPA: ATP-binding protein [Gemmatimonadaceae bacterium]|jgi:serine/threonine-protein kinase RsbW|nr:ATP-binding protein [Gemmatimonadaceae bacterium]
MARARDPLDSMRVVIELEVPNDVRRIEQIVELVSRQIRELDFPARACSLNIPVALSEALSNAMLRGNADDSAKHVRVRALVDKAALVLEITDEGVGFDIDRCTRDPTTPENVVREDGRGLYLMHQLMDRVERYTDGGNVVRLTLKRP